MNRRADVSYELRALAFSLQSSHSRFQRAVGSMSMTPEAKAAARAEVRTIRELLSSIRKELL